MQSQRSNQLSVRMTLGLALMGMLLLVLIVGQFWIPYDSLAIDLSATLAPPSATHWFGTDEFGRDVFSRAIMGARISAGLGFSTVLCAVPVGALLGSIAAFFRGWTDLVLMAVNNALLALPSMLLALGVVAVFGPRTSSIVVALSLAYLPVVVRVARSVVLSIREREYIEASVVMGNSRLYSLFRHVAPNALPQIASLATNMFGWAVLTESALSFLGVGIPAPAPTWGNMLASARPYLDSASWLSIAPGACIAVTLLGVNLLGDAMRDRADPRRAA
jgi:peptide/nickel transport system permease protein